MLGARVIHSPSGSAPTISLFEFGEFLRVTVDGDVRR
jgi:hypothetical protein